MEQTEGIIEWVSFQSTEDADYQLMICTEMQSNHA